MSLRDNIKIVKLTQTIIKLRKGLTGLQQEKRVRMGIRTTIENSSSRSNFEKLRIPNNLRNIGIKLCKNNKTH
jgi:hypothetical protein